jgi:hypothetical protein
MPEGGHSLVRRDLLIDHGAIRESKVKSGKSATPITPYNHSVSLSAADLDDDAD